MTGAERDRRYDELVQEIGRSLLEAAPPGWARLDLVATLTSSVQDYGLVVLLGDGTSAEVEPPPSVADAFVALRELMYRPERGAWLSTRFVMDPPSEYHAFYNFQHDPVWDPPVPDEVLRADLARFPRPEEEIPNWLRRRLGMPTSPPQPDPAGLVEQRDLHRRVTDLLVMHAPSDWTELRVGYRAAGSFIELPGYVLSLNRQLRPWNPPAAVAEEFAALRARMIPPGTGAGPWSGAQVNVEFPVHSSLTFTYDPPWNNTPPRAAVLDDLRRFPRSPEHVPAWMRAIVPDVEQVLSARARFREARVFDRHDATGHPVVDRPRVPADEVTDVLRYLNEAHVVLFGRGHDTDLFGPDSVPDVPAAFHTDGTWLWPASIPHYLAKHGVPPEPELVDHIRAANFTPPPVDPATAAAAHTALTGEVTGQMSASHPATGQTPVELSDSQRKELAQIALALSEAGINPRAYSLDGPADGSWCLERAGDEWQVAQYERGQAFAARRFPTLFEAGAYLLGTLTILPARRHAGGPDTNTVAALNDWPVQPLPGEPPLTLLTHKRMAVLMAGREVLRHGGPGGNQVFTPNTRFPEMSLRADREADGPRRYRVTRDLRVLAGTTVPWHGQPGGGRGYLLPRSIGEHLADGSLVDITSGK